MLDLTDHYDGFLPDRFYTLMFLALCYVKPILIIINYQANTLGSMLQVLNSFRILDLALLRSSCLILTVVVHDLLVERLFYFLACDCICVGWGGNS